MFLSKVIYIFMILWLTENENNDCYEFEYKGCYVNAVIIFTVGDESCDDIEENLTRKGKSKKLEDVAVKAQGKSKKKEKYKRKKKGKATVKQVNNSSAPAFLYVDLEFKEVFVFVYLLEKLCKTF